MFLLTKDVYGSVICQQAIEKANLPQMAMPTRFGI
jgi:hypothetical protein